MLSEAVLEVVSTYAYRAVTSIIFWALGGCFGIIWLLTMSSAQHDGLALGLASVQAIFLTMAIASHAKGQFTHERARVVPGYRSAHLSVAIAASAIPAVFIPTLMACGYGVWPVGIVAVAIVVAGLVWWGVLRGSAMTLMAGGVVCIAMMPPHGQKVFTWLLRGEDSPAAWGIIILGLAMIGLAIWRLGIPVDGKKAMDCPEAWNTTGTRSYWRWIERQRERELDRIEQNHPGRMWSRIIRWQPAFRRDKAFWFEVGSYTAVFALFWTIEPKAVDPLDGFVGFWLIGMPSMDGLSHWFGRKRRVLWEIVRPVGRREFFLEIGGAIFVNMLKTWVVFWTGAAIAAVAVGVAGKMPMHEIMEYMSVSLAAQIFMFGVIARGALFRSESGRAVAGAAGIFTILGTVMVLYLRLIGSLTLAAIMVMAGAALAWVAYHRWLQADLD